MDGVGLVLDGVTYYLLPTDMLALGLPTDSHGLRMTGSWGSGWGNYGFKGTKISKNGQGGGTIILVD